MVGELFADHFFVCGDEVGDKDSVDGHALKETSVDGRSCELDTVECDVTRVHILYPCSAEIDVGERRFREVDVIKERSLEVHIVKLRTRQVAVRVFYHLSILAVSRGGGRPQWSCTATASSHRSNGIR